MRFLLLLVIACSVVGCKSAEERSDELRRESFVEANSDLAPNVREAILAGEILPGMLFAEVGASWGLGDAHLQHPEGLIFEEYELRLGYVGRGEVIILRFIDCVLIDWEVVRR